MLKACGAYIRSADAVRYHKPAGAARQRDGEDHVRPQAGVGVCNGKAGKRQGNVLRRSQRVVQPAVGALPYRFWRYGIAGVRLIRGRRDDGGRAVDCKRLHYLHAASQADIQRSRQGGSRRRTDACHPPLQPHGVAAARQACNNIQAPQRLRRRRGGYIQRAGVPRRQGVHRVVVCGAVAGVVRRGGHLPPIQHQAQRQVCATGGRQGGSQCWCGGRQDHHHHAHIYIPCTRRLQPRGTAACHRAPCNGGGSGWQRGVDKAGGACQWQRLTNHHQAACAGIAVATACGQPPCHIGSAARRHLQRHRRAVGGAQYCAAACHVAAVATRDGAAHR